MMKLPPRILATPAAEAMMARLEEKHGACVRRALGAGRRGKV